MAPAFLSSRHEALAAQARAQCHALEALGEGAGERGPRALADAVLGLGFQPHLLAAAAEPSDLLAVCVLREELAYRNPAADALFAVHGLGLHPVVRAGTLAQKAQWLAAADEERTLFAFALTEQDAGSDVSALVTSARRAPDGGYVLEGRKRFVSSAGVATHYTLFARTGGPRSGISAFVVPADAPGLRVEPMRLLSDHLIGELALEGCAVSESARLGEEGDGLSLALGALDVFRPTVGAAAVGMARRALDEAVAHAKTRRQFGAPLADLPAVQAMLADSAVELDAARLLVHRAAAQKDGGAPRIPYEGSVAKLFATEAAQRIVDRCLQIHGGAGLVRGSSLERLYREVRALRIYEGASEVQRLIIARQLVGRTPEGT